jgi:hypothetical protein
MGEYRGGQLARLLGLVFADVHARRRHEEPGSILGALLADLAHGLPEQACSFWGAETTEAGTLFAE